MKFADLVRLFLFISNKKPIYVSSLLKMSRLHLMGQLTSAFQFLFFSISNEFEVQINEPKQKFEVSTKKKKKYFWWALYLPPITT